MVDQIRGVLALELGDCGGALESSRSGLSVAMSIRSSLTGGQCATCIVNALLMDADSEPTVEVIEMLALIRDTRNLSQLSFACEPVADYIARRGALETASVIAGVLRRHAPFGSFGARQRAETLELVANLSNVDTLMARGAAMSPTEAIDFAIEHVEQLIHAEG